MKEYDLKPPDKDVEGAFEAAVTALGLGYSRHSLRGYEGCTHWHITMPREKGTLEATWWPIRRRLWISVHANRRAAWHEMVIEQLREALNPSAGES